MDYSEPDDLSFLSRVQEGRVQHFGHRDHLRLAFLSARAGGTPDEVVERCRAGIRAVASAHAAPDKYHETITAAWVAIMLQVAAARPLATFDEVLVAYPALEDTAYLERYYSPARLMCDDARSRRLAPDRAPLPS
jgi:hypothetical protein